MTCDYRWRSSYKGLARAVIQVSKYCVDRDEAMKRFAEIDVETGLNTAFSCEGVEDPIVIRATSPVRGTLRAISFDFCQFFGTIWLIWTA